MDEKMVIPTQISRMIVRDAMALKLLPIITALRRRHYDRVLRELALFIQTLCKTKRYLPKFTLLDEILLPELVSCDDDGY